MGRGLTVTIKVGGFLFPNQPNPEAISAYAEVLETLAKRDFRVLVVAGGGENARRYIEVARKLGADEGFCDQMGIEVSRLNAQLLIARLKDYAYHKPPTTIEEAKGSLRPGRIVVMGGLTPGHSTTAVAALVAEATWSDFLIIESDVDGIYTADPKLDKEAKILERITTKRLISMALSGRIWAGGYQLDPVAVKVIERSKIPTFFINGKDPHNPLRVLDGERLGTRIISRG